MLNFGGISSERNHLQGDSLSWMGAPDPNVGPRKMGNPEKNKPYSPIWYLCVTSYIPQESQG